jgi:DNA-binding response OmpR family regulator
MSRRERGRIGIIEDDLVVGGTLAHRLELEGYSPLWWCTGREALEGLRTQRPELVVCDILLPDMSGKDVFLRALPELGGKPFLFVTAHAQIEDAVFLMKAGAVDYLEKPYALPDLLARITRLTASRRPRNLSAYHARRCSRRCASSIYAPSLTPDLVRTGGRAERPGSYHKQC